MNLRLKEAGVEFPETATIKQIRLLYKSVFGRNDNDDVDDLDAKDSAKEETHKTNKSEENEHC